MTTAAYDRAHSAYGKAAKDHLRSSTAQVESLAIAESTNASAQMRRAIKDDHKHPRQSQKLADEIGNNLVLEVRKLRDKIQDLETARASEQQDHDYAVLQRQQLERQQDQLKDENWDLELAKQELEEQLDSANKKLSRMNVEYARLEQQLQDIIDVKTEQVKSEAETSEAARQQEQQRHELVKELRALKKENADLLEQLQTSTTEVRLWKSKFAIATHANSSVEKLQADLAQHPDPVDDENSSMTPPGSPPLPTKITVHMEAESLKHALAHAHRTITNLRSSLHKEKLDRIETKKLLAESQETIEELRREALSNQYYRKKYARRSSRQRRRARAKRTHHYNTSDEDTPAVAENSNCDNIPSTNRESSIYIPQNSLFDELQKSVVTISNDKETQTSAPEKVDKQTQTDFAALNTVQYIHNNSPVLVTEGTQTPAIRQSYFEPFKRALHDTSKSLRSKKQQSAWPLERSQSIPRGTISVNPMPAASIPPTISITNQPQPQSFTRTPSTGTASSVDRRSKLLEYVSKYNSTQLPHASTPPNPAASVSTATSLHLDKDQVIPSASRSDTIAARSSIRFSPRGSPTLDTLIEAIQDPDVIDPSVIDAVTQTMIGNWMWKYTRRFSTVGKGSISQQKGHMRYFWIHPYTRTLYWSSKPPGVNHDETKSKRAFIKDIWSVPCGENQCESVPFNLLIRTSVRDLMIHAESMHQHNQWIAATCYLLGRPEQIEAEGRFLSSVSTSTTTVTSGNTHSTHNGTFLNSSILQGSIISSQSDDDSDDFINIRQCCNGKHDVSTLSRR